MTLEVFYRQKGVEKEICSLRKTKRVSEQGTTIDHPSTQITTYFCNHLVIINLDH